MQHRASADPDVMTHGLRRPVTLTSPTGTSGQVAAGVAACTGTGVQPAVEACGVAPFELVEHRLPQHDQFATGRSGR